MKVDFPGLDIRLGGYQRRQAESMASLIQSCGLALLFVYMLLAIIPCLCAVIEDISCLLSSRQSEEPGIIPV